MKSVVLLVAAFLVACATVDYRPYEGNSTQYEGTGGTKLTVDGVDFWSNGTPPRKFSLLGVVTSEVGAGYGDEYLIRSAVAGPPHASGRMGPRRWARGHQLPASSGVVRHDAGLGGTRPVRTSRSVNGPRPQEEPCVDGTSAPPRCSLR